MIKKLTINQTTKSLEYATENEWYVCNEDQHYPIEKLEVYNIMKQVIINWNENNPTLQLCEKEECHHPSNIHCPCEK